MTIWLADSCKTNLRYVVNGLKPERARLLLSYFYFRDTNIGDLFRDCSPMPWVFLDSGAFSAATQGAKIDVGEYAAYVERNIDHIEIFANLDCIGNAQRTRANQEFLERRGLRPLPVFHAGEAWSVLEQMVSQYDYIGLGGIAIKRTQRFAPWIKRCFEIAEGNRLHGFGVSNWFLLRAFPWFSTDHSSWGSGFRYGSLPLFDPRQGRFVKVNLRDRETAWRCSRLLYACSGSPTDTALWTRDKRAALCHIGAVSWMRAARWLTGWHEQNDSESHATKEVTVCQN